MIGAIIGDLAAWTYEYDRETFWRQLISYDEKEIELSVYAHAYFRAASKNVLTVYWQDVSYIGEPGYTLQYKGQWLMWQLMCAWLDIDSPKDCPQNTRVDKEEYYAKTITCELIRYLRKGYSKTQAFNAVPNFKEFIKGMKWRAWDDDVDTDSTLTNVFRAWDSFYRSHDFTSAIHNAMRWDGDRHLVAMLTASFASAMYGCRQNMIKQKYADGQDNIHTFDLLCFGEQFGYSHALCHEMISITENRRLFWPKNNARTDVEWHHWVPMHSAHTDKVITPELRRRIIRSFEPGWEDRYSFYLDDGWLYICRSYSLIARFRFSRCVDGTYRLCYIEACDGSNDVETALECALYSVEHHWDALCSFDSRTEIDDCLATV